MIVMNNGPVQNQQNVASDKPVVMNTEPPKQKLQESKEQDLSANQQYKAQLFRNRGDLEIDLIDKTTGEVTSRIPTEWKPRDGKLDYLSVSKIQSYEQCPACFYREYMSEETKHVDNANYFTKFGTVLHEVCEKVMRSVKDIGLAPAYQSFLPEAWEHAGMAGFGSIADYDQASELLDGYFKKNPPTDRPEFPIMLEEEWRGELGGYTFGLMMDYVGQFIANDNQYLLRDYKTNRMPYTSADLAESLQLRIYKLVLKRHYLPDAEKIICGYDLFFHGWQQCPDYTDDDLKRAEEYVHVIGKNIEQDTIWEERLNNYCCYRECRHTCSTYKKFFENSQSFFAPFDRTNMEDVEKQRQIMTAIEKNAKQCKDECAAIIKAAIEQKSMNGETLVVGDRELSLYSQSRKSYRYQDVYNVLLANNRLDLLSGCLTIQKTKFDKNLDSQMKLMLAGCVDNGYASPTIVSKKI